jgi:Tol biopolymer transport system component
MRSSVGKWGVANARGFFGSASWATPGRRGSDGCGGDGAARVERGVDAGHERPDRLQQNHQEERNGIRSRRLVNERGWECGGSADHGADSYEGTYSPDGSRLAFGRYDEIIVAAADGSGARTLAFGSTKYTTVDRWVSNFKDPDTGTNYPWVKFHEFREDRDTLSEPSFSPDGSALAVTHYSGAHVIQSVCSVNAKNDASCNGAYEANFYPCENCGSSIETIDSNTGATLATWAPKTSGVYLFSPSFSHAGSIAYTHDVEGVSGDGQVLLVASPGADPITLASGGAEDPDFSPDGSQVVFTTGQHELGIVPATGGAPRVISVPPPVAADKVWIAKSPVWSPDGSQIAFADLGVPGTGGGFEFFSDGGVFLIHPDGSGMVPIQGDATVPSGWQPLPPPPPAPPVLVRAVKGKRKVRLTKKGLGVVGKVICGSTACALKAKGAKLKVGKKSYAVKSIFPKTLTPGATAKVKVKVKGKALAALKARRTGKLRLSLQVSDGSGIQTFPFGPKLLPPKAHKKSR